MEVSYVNGFIIHKGSSRSAVKYHLCLSLSLSLSLFVLKIRALHCTPLEFRTGFLVHNTILRTKPMHNRILFIHLKTHTKGHFLIGGKNDRGLSTLWALCVHTPCPPKRTTHTICVQTQEWRLRLVPVWCEDKLWCGLSWMLAQRLW